MKITKQMFNHPYFIGILLWLSCQTAIAAPYFEGTGYINEQTSSHILFNHYEFPLSPVVKVYDLKNKKIKVQDIDSKVYVQINVIKVVGKIYVDVIKMLPESEAPTEEAR